MFGNRWKAKYTVTRIFGVLLFFLFSFLELSIRKKYLASSVRFFPALHDSIFIP